MEQIVKVKKYSDSDIMNAFAIYRASNLNEAFKVTRIPRAVLRRRFAYLEGIGEGEKTDVAKEVRNKVMEQAIERASFYLSDKVIDLSNKLFDTANEALDQTRALVKSRIDPDNANYIKSLVNVWQTAIQSGQLLSNKPTSREEVNIKQANPEDLTDEQLAQVISAGKAALSKN
jgi:hypothetical protein